MGTKTNKKSTSIRLDSELRRRVDQKLLDRKYGDSKLTFEGAVHEALELWLRSGQRSPPPAPAKFPESHHKWHELLEGILTNGGQDVIQAIHGNLEVFDSYARIRSPKKQAG